jgi:lysophospholipase L1-like esterase
MTRAKKATGRNCLPSTAACFLLLSLIPAGTLFAQEPDWSHLQADATLQATTASEDGVSVLHIAYDQKAGDTKPGRRSEMTAPFQMPAGSAAQGISFEVRGDGSGTYASVLLGDAGNPDAGAGYEAIFPLASRDWHKVTLPWSAFTENYLPWDKKLAQDETTLTLDPSKIGSIGFGWGNYFTNFYPTHASFDIRNVALAGEAAAPAPPGTFSEGWSHTQSLLGHGQTLKILLIGDSITDFGGPRSYGYFLGQKIQQTWGNACEVANCGIAGHTVRGGLIVLPRSLHTMPDPDLVCVLFGANDIKALGVKPEFTEAVFRTELEQLIDRIRAGTGGKADLCLLNGVPRLLPNSSDSAGTIEKIDAAVKEASVEKKTAFVDTFAAYLVLTPEQKKIDYRDTVHQKPAGQEFLGNLVFTELRSATPGAK